MSIRMVTQGTIIAWDGVNQDVPAGTLVDVPPGSALEAAYGLENLEDLDADVDADAAAAAAAHTGVTN